MRMHASAAGIYTCMGFLGVFFQILPTCTTIEEIKLGNRCFQCTRDLHNNRCFFCSSLLESFLQFQPEDFLCIRVQGPFQAGYCFCDHLQSWGKMLCLYVGHEDTDDHVLASFQTDLLREYAQFVNTCSQPKLSPELFSPQRSLCSFPCW